MTGQSTSRKKVQGLCWSIERGKITERGGCARKGWKVVPTYGYLKILLFPAIFRRSYQISQNWRWNIYWIRIKVWNFVKISVSRWLRSLKIINQHCLTSAHISLRKEILFSFCNILKSYLQWIQINAEGMVQNLMKIDTIFDQTRLKFKYMSLVIGGLRSKIKWLVLEIHVLPTTYHHLNIF